MKRKIKVPVPQVETTLQYTSHFLNENLYEDHHFLEGGHGSSNLKTPMLNAWFKF